MSVFDIQMNLGLPKTPRYCSICYCLTHIVDWTYTTNPEVIRMIGSNKPIMTIPHPQYTVRIDCMFCNLSSVTKYAQRGDEFIPFEVHTERHGFY